MEDPRQDAVFGEAIFGEAIFGQPGEIEDPNLALDRLRRTVGKRPRGKPSKWHIGVAPRSQWDRVRL